MKNWKKELGVVVLMTAVLPNLILAVALRFVKAPAALPEATTPIVMPPQQLEITVLLPDGTRTQMNEKTYLTRVLLCEMPAGFEMEAKKAQAVVARTYALRTSLLSSRHGGAVCTDSGCCQGYREEGDYLDAGGAQAAVDAAAEAVEQTRGQVLVYDGALIDATYFSCSGGRTEDAVAVWGSDVPYLQAVDSPGEEQATHFTDTVTFSARSFREALGEELPGEPSRWFGKVSYSSGGGVAEMEIGGVRYSGTQLRKLLGLRSTAFSLTAIGDSIIITTRGFGHRVGMSQYGADAMAALGNDYRQILFHYYQGVSLSQWTGE